MNPWHLLRREIDGAIRSVRYDLAVRRARRGMNEATTELPVITATPPLSGDAGRKRRVILATSSVLVAAGAVSGYYAVTSGLDALIADGGSPARLPETGSRFSSPTASQVDPTATTPGAVRVPIAHSSVIPPRATQTTAGPPIGTPPVPTPAPTCNCPTGSPSPSASPSPSPTPSSTQPTATPTSTAT
ncbi:MAG TPA: hypothetical protein DGG94_14085, partial [Micromonosporaceae bacterium]|nr:hypothetical protein [Micromonosporaceae bacterium]